MHQLIMGKRLESTISTAFIDTPRWLLLGLLVLAPWLYGGTEPWAITAINWSGGVAAGLWLLTCLLRQRMPDVPRGPAIVGMLLILLAWWMAWNAKFDYDALQKEFRPREAWLAWAPGSVHREASLDMAWRVTVLMGVIFFACDLARRSIWRRRLLWTIAFAGLSIVALGLAQGLTGATAILWGNVPQDRSFFGTYRYHSNAGAYLNLVWPVVAGFFALTLLRGSGWQVRVAWGTALVFCGAGVLVTASRAAGVIALLLGGVWMLWLLRQAWLGQIEGVSHAMTGATAALLVLLMGGLAAVAGMETTARRWAKFDKEITLDNPRLQVAQACLGMAPEAGLFGLGPGTFQSAFPYFAQGLQANTRGVWEHAHNDYLETLAEWGGVGAVLWAVLVLGGIVRATWLGWRHRERLGITERVTFSAMLTALSGVLIHAVVDYPLQIASIQIYVGVMLGMFWGARHWLDLETPSESRHRRRSSKPSAAAKDSEKSF